MRRKEESSKQGEINNKAKQHSTPEAVTFPFALIYILLVRDEKEGRKQQARSNKQQSKATQHTRGSRTRTHDTLHSRQSALPLGYQGSSTGWAQIAHLTQCEGEGRGNDTKDLRFIMRRFYMYSNYNYA